VADVAVAAATIAGAAAVLVLTGYAVHRLGRRHGRLSERGVDWATNLGVPAVLSFALSLVMTTINVGLTASFPTAFLTSILVGLVVATPTAYFMFPWIRHLMEPLAAPTTPTEPAPDPDAPSQPA